MPLTINPSDDSLFVSIMILNELFLIQIHETFKYILIIIIFVEAFLIDAI